MAVPRIIPRAGHPISRGYIDPDALRILYRLHRAGYQGYLVGGSVRDLMTGRTQKDFEIGTNARPQEIRRLFRNSRIIGRRFRLVHVFFDGGKIVEVSTFRRRPDAADARLLRSLVCESFDRKIFTYVLTPDFNAAHADHFHMEIKPGVRWFLYH